MSKEINNDIANTLSNHAYFYGTVCGWKNKQERNNYTRLQTLWIKSFTGDSNCWRQQIK